MLATTSNDPSQSLQEPLRIVIDAREVRPQLNGLGRYTINLLSGLASIDPVNKYTVLAYHPEGVAFLKDFPNFKILPTDVHVVDPREQVFLPYLMQREKADIFHSPSMVAPLIAPKRCATLMTIHDTIPLVCPEGFPWYWSLAWQLYYAASIRPAAHRSTHVITVSDNSRRDLARHLDLPLEKISVIHNWHQKSYHPIKDLTLLEDLRKRYALPGRFILYVGSTFKYKNLHRLFEAFAGLEGDLPLVLATRPERHLLETAQRFGIADRIQFLGYVPEQDLPLLYNAASLFVYPSIYEGFGLPPLEAMACGLPAVVGDCSSLPEVVGNAALRVDPRDPRALREAMRKLIQDPILTHSLSEQGMRQATRFSRELAIRQTLNIYAGVACANRSLFGEYAQA